MTTRVLSVHAVAGTETDGVADHARILGDHLQAAGLESRIVAVDWRHGGWMSALSALRRLNSAKPSLIVLHYSHLAWTRRGLPFGFVFVTLVCRASAPVLLWIHDPGPIEGERLRQRCGSVLKAIGLRTAVRLAKRSVVSVDPDRVYWVDSRTPVVFNPSPSNVTPAERVPPTDLFTIATFGTRLTSHPKHVARLGRVCEALAGEFGPFRLRVLGDNADLPAHVLKRLSECGTEVDVPGLQSPMELGRRLSRSHVFWHVRGGLTTRSGTLAAALSCGLPVVGNRGVETGFPLNGGGVAVVADDAELITTFVELGQNARLQGLMSDASRVISDRFYSWEAACRPVIDAASEREV